MLLPDLIVTIKYKRNDNIIAKTPAKIRKLICFFFSLIRNKQPTKTSGNNHTIGFVIITHRNDKAKKRE